MAAEPAVPERLGRYEVIGALARGGMAEVYVARLPGVEGFAKRVAIKRVLPELARDREFVDMLIAEARVAAQLEHQNIVHVHDIGYDAGGYFFAMELLHGADVGTILRTSIERGMELPLGVALEIARAACAGLHYAHERVGGNGAPLGLVHRDVSPQNVFVTFDGAVKLLDFGIARAVERISNHYTRSGTLRGKVPYMSPEQCRAEPLDRRSDVFSLAIVLWEMTVGARLFGANNEGDYHVMRAIVDEDAPRPSTRKPGYPPELERIVMKGLSRDRAQRYQTADELLVELERYSRDHALWTTPREVAAFVVQLLPDRVEDWRRSARDDTSQGAQIVPFPNAPRATVELPPARPTAPRAAATRERPPDPAPPPPAPGRPRRALWVAGAVAVAGIALAVGFSLGRAGGSAAPHAATPGATTTPAPPRAPEPVGEDAHWFQPDDFLISAQPYRGERLRELWVAKALPDRPGVFLDGRGREWTPEATWRTRPVRTGELAVGRLAFCRVDAFERTSQAPKDKVEARTRTWTLARVTDVSALSNGSVTVGDVECRVDGVRVVAE